ncbi:MAG: hypothetical protein QG608_3544 [Actinomycetota bacterium]|nr:hypothetical protein [Actinomycetota bacterium]
MKHRVLGGFTAWIVGVTVALGCSWVALRSVGQELRSGGSGSLTATPYPHKPSSASSSPTGLVSGIGEPLPAPSQTRTATPSVSPARAASPTSSPDQERTRDRTGERGDEPDQDKTGQGGGDSGLQSGGSVAPDGGTWWVGGGRPAAQAVQISGGQVMLQCEESRLLDFEARPASDWLVRVSNKEEGRVWFTFRHAGSGQEIVVQADCTDGSPHFTAHLGTG